MVVALLGLPEKGFSQYDTEILSIAHENNLRCEDLAPNCKSSSLPKSIHDFYKLASETCKQEQSTLKCSDFNSDPELKKRIRDCSAQALCDESQNTVGLSLKGCFWSAPGSWGSDAWSTVKESAEKTYEKMKEGPSFVHPLQIIFRSVPVITPEKVMKAANLPAHIYSEAEKWLVEKKVKLQCYNRQAQAELLCYGALHVFAPGAALKAGQQVPKLIQALKLTPEIPPERNIAEIIDQTKRRPDSTARKTQDAPRSIVRQSFIDDNLNLNFTSVAQNEEWMKLAANVKPDKHTKFFEVENSVMKELNDTTQDKNFVTALTNKNKQILNSKIEAFMKAHPEIEILPYSDFKAMRYAIRPKPPAQQLPKEIQKELDQLFREANTEFSEFMQSQKLVRAGDKPEEWFRAGFGETADQATLSSRYSRNISGANQVRNFNDPDFRENLKTALKASEMYRRNLQKDFAKSGMMEEIPGSNKMIFKKEVFEAIRKTSTNEELMQTFEKSFGTKITETQAMQIRDYSNLVNEFSPGIHVAERKIASLSQSTQGGLSIDFSGLGADNLKATAISLTRSSNIKEAVIETRLGERSVSESFFKKKQAVQSSVDSVLKKHGIQAEIADSGDDMVIKPDKPIPEKVRAEIAKSLAENVSPSAVRVAHVPDGVAVQADRMIIATHGETLEKLTRKNLQGEIPKEKLNQILLFVDMQTKAAGKGSAKLLIESNHLNLNDFEKQKIKNAFDKAIKDMNTKLLKENESAEYRPAG